MHVNALKKDVFRFTRLLCAVLLAGAAASCAAVRGMMDADAAAFAANARLGVGINLGNALDAPREGAWGVVLQEDYFRLIHEAGFASVRLPVRWSAHALEKPPYTVDPEFFKRVDWALEQARRNRLGVVLNMHHYNELTAEPAAHRERFLAIWEQIARRYAKAPDSVCFEILNEPMGKLTDERWNSLLVEALAVIRKSNPRRMVVVGPAEWNGIRKLPALKLPEADRWLIVTVHCYSPFQFTHQGEEWVRGSAPWLGTKWNGTDAEKAALCKELDQAAEWGRANRRPVYLGEFGAYSKADMESRARWTRFMREAAAARGMSSAYWEFCSGFGAYDPIAKAWRRPLLDALLKEKKPDVAP
jgi:endoglucanase